MEPNRTRRNFLKVAGAAATAFSACPRSLCGATGGGGAGPNIVYLFSDEHRYQSMSFTEMPALKTPNMARMAQEGTSFEYAISNNPVCVPHRCMLLSGQWPHRTGAIENQGGLAPWDRTLGHIFGEAGYATGYAGKWHAGGFPAQAGFGWHMHWGNTNVHWDSSWTDLHGAGTTETCKTYQPVKMTDQALEFIEAGAAAKKPFFLMVSWNPPHANFTDAPEEKKALYPDESALPWRANAEEKSKAKWWDDYQGYHAHITAIDGEIGRIFDRLEKLGVLGNTIVIYSADHGSMMNSHGKGNKRFPHDESCRVPFLAVGPGIPSGQVRRELFGTIDVFPTLCGLAGIPVPAFCDGQDFSPNVRNLPGIRDPESQLLMHVASAKGVAKKGAAAPTREELLDYHTPFYRGVRGKRYTYAVGCSGDWVLWDNLTDPLQQKNLIGDPAYADVRRAMRAQLDAWLAKAEYPFLHEAYREMALPQSILQQAVDGAVNIPLHHVVARLKLSPEQHARVPEIHARYYGKDGKPKDRSAGRISWERAEQSVAADIRGLLDGAQQERFDQMMAYSKIRGESGNEN